MEQARKVIAQAGLEDPCPFWDDDGQAYLIHGRVGAGPLVLHRMSADGMRVLDDGKVIAEDKARLPVLEGPKLYKRDGWYYIFAPTGGVGTGPQAVGRSRSIWGPYEWLNVLVPGAGLAGPHQGGWVETPSGQGWFAHFNATGSFGRIVHLQPVKWVDGWPVMGDNGQPVTSFAMPDTGTPPSNARLQDSDEFSGPTLGLQWSWNHNPDDRAWSLSKRPGFLRLTAGRADYLVGARNTLTQILQGPGSRITARLEIGNMAEGQRAGLTLFGVRPSWIGIVRSAGHTRVTVASEGVETAGPEIGSASVVLRAEVFEDQTVRYSWSADGWRFQAFGGPIPLARFSWWKGSRPALFTFTRGDASGGFIDADWFRVTPLERLP